MSDLACLSCGACCAAFRVDFHRADLATAGSAGVPVKVTVPLTATLVRMRGTDEAPPRCIALAFRKQNTLLGVQLLRLQQLCHRLLQFFQAGAY